MKQTIVSSTSWREPSREGKLFCRVPSIHRLTASRRLVVYNDCSYEKDETREARESDLPGIIELYAQLVPGDPQPDMEKLRIEWKHILSKGEKIRYFVAEKKGKIVSTCNIAIVPNLTLGARLRGAGCRG